MHSIMGEGQRATILVVEDDALILEMAIDALDGAGFNVIGVSAAEDALGLAVTDVPFDALFTDVDLGGAIDGWELAEILREMRPNLPVVYTSGRPGHARSVPHSAFLVKPYRIAELCALMRQAAVEEGVLSPALATALSEPNRRAELRLIA